MENNPYAAPQSSPGPQRRAPSKRGLRHYFLLMLTAWLFSYGAGSALLLWGWIEKGEVPPFVGGLLALVWGALAVGVLRSFYRPWLGKLAFCMALGASALYMLWCVRVTIIPMSGYLRLQFLAAASCSFALAAWGAIMSWLAIRSNAIALHQ